MRQSNIELNIQAIKEISKESPATTHIIMRRPDGQMVDIPLAHAEFTARQHDDWVVENGAVPQIEFKVSKQQAQDELPILPPKPSEEAPVVLPEKIKKTPKPRAKKKK